MGFWRAFDAGEVRADFARVAAAGFDSVRVFLLWEDFQPTPDRVEPRMLARLVEVMELALGAGLEVMPTLFTGHMSGVNWIPPWALGGGDGDARFRIVSGGRVVAARCLDWYVDAGVFAAQAALARAVAGALAGHAALSAWDLGNENSNCVVPPTRAHGSAWLARMADAIRAADPGARVTIGLHMEDLEQDRNLGPAEAAASCDFLTMHGYPGYASFARGATDERLLPFLARLTSRLGGGADVLFSEFGVPTYAASDPESEAARAGASSELVEEIEAAAYIERALVALATHGATGAWLWCHADYDRALWDRPPLDLATHERSFGVFRADGSPKPSVAAARRARERIASAAASATAMTPDDAWLDVDAAEYQRDPKAHLARLYARFCAVSA
jgi:endo-1,4-beta-mannosidase